MEPAHASSPCRCDPGIKQKFVYKLAYLCKLSSVEYRLFHHQHGPKPRMPTHHMIVCLVSFGKGERLNHALDVMKLRKVDSFFAVQCLAGRPAVDRGALLNHDRAVDLDPTTRCQGQCRIRLTSRDATYETTGSVSLPAPTHSPNLPWPQDLAPYSQSSPHRLVSSKPRNDSLYWHLHRHARLDPLQISPSRNRLTTQRLCIPSCSRIAGPSDRDHRVPGLRRFRRS